MPGQPGIGECFDAARERHEAVANIEAQRTRMVQRAGVDPHPRDAAPPAERQRVRHQPAAMPLARQFWHDRQIGQLALAALPEIEFEHRDFPVAAGRVEDPAEHALVARLAPAVVAGLRQERYLDVLEKMNEALYRDYQKLQKNKGDGHINLTQFMIENEDRIFSGKQLSRLAQRIGAGKRFGNNFGKRNKHIYITEKAYISFIDSLVESIEKWVHREPTFTIVENRIVK